MRHLLIIFSILMLSGCSLLNYESTEVTGTVVSAEPYSYECVTPFTSSRLQSDYYSVATIPSYWYNSYQPSIFRLDCRNNEYEILVKFENPITGEKENKVLRRFKSYSEGEQINFDIYYKK